MDLRQTLREFASGGITFEELVGQFGQQDFQPRQPTKGDWGKVYLRAEEGDDTPDVPGILAAAKFAKQVTPAEYTQLMGIYRQRVTQGPATAPAAGPPSAG